MRPATRCSLETATCQNMVEMAQATMHMMMRPAGMNMDVMSAMMTACMTMGKGPAPPSVAPTPTWTRYAATARWPATTWS